MEAPSAVAERTRVLNDDELKWLWEAAQEEARPYREILEDLVLLGQRRGEVAGLPWAELNRQRQEWHLPAARAKNACENIVPLTDRMIAKLDKLVAGTSGRAPGWSIPRVKARRLAGGQSSSGGSMPRLPRRQRRRVRKSRRGNSTICAARSQPTTAAPRPIRIRRSSICFYHREQLADRDRQGLTRRTITSRESRWLKRWENELRADRQRAARFQTSSRLYA